MTGANQELSLPTHVTQDLAMRQVSSNSDSNIAEVQLSFSEIILPRFRAVLGLMKSRIKFLASVIFRRQKPFKQRDKGLVVTKTEGEF